MSIRAVDEPHRWHEDRLTDAVTPDRERRRARDVAVQERVVAAAQAQRDPDVRRPQIESRDLAQSESHDPTIVELDWVRAVPGVFRDRDERVAGEVRSPGTRRAPPIGWIVRPVQCAEVERPIRRRMAEDIPADGPDKGRETDGVDLGERVRRAGGGLPPARGLPVTQPFVPVVPVMSSETEPSLLDDSSSSPSPSPPLPEPLRLPQLPGCVPTS